MTEKNGKRYYRKVIRIRAEDSPNVRLGLAERSAKRSPSNRILLPGVLPFSDYEKRRAVWDKIRQCIGLDGLFYEGAEVLLYPPEWLNRAEQLADALDLAIPRHERIAEAIGVDVAEGGDDTAWSAIDRMGLIELIWKQTSDTSVIHGDTLAFMRRHHLLDSPEKVIFDAGGGGKQHADNLRAAGYDVQTVAFGEAATKPLRYGKKVMSERRDEKEERQMYNDRRAEMYGTLRWLMEPTTGAKGFAIPAEYVMLRQELAPIPLLYSREGKLRLPPKRRINPNTNTGEKSLIDLIGWSPDRADSLMMAVWLLFVKPAVRVAGVLG